MMAGIAAMVAVGLATVTWAQEAVTMQEKRTTAVPTFECLGLYWSPEEGSEGTVCGVRYRGEGDTSWREGLPLWFDARNKEYRGSIMHLRPATTYEIELSLRGAEAKAALKAATWADALPVAETVRLEDVSGETLVITRSGTPDGYVLYAPNEGKPATIDVANQRRHCVEVRASYVILHGLTLKNASVHGVVLEDGVHDVMIEECDISGWGRIADDGWGLEMDGGIYAARREDKLYAGPCRTERVIIQRNRIHHPRSDANSWSEQRPGKGDPGGGCHPEGPQAIVLGDTQGNHVIRYNSIYSDESHCFNDGMGGWHNYSQRGCPNRDTDIYGNLLRNCWDDAIEAEGGNRNVRIWGNYLDQTYVAVACATTSIGPLYVWRNVSGAVRGSPTPPFYGGFLKTSHKQGGGPVYVFHNTVWQPPPLPGMKHTRGCTLALGWCPMLNVTSRNNILHVSDFEPEERFSIKEFEGSGFGDYDYDLYSGRLDVPAGNEAHGIRGVPRYEPEVALDPNTGAGRFTLSRSSPGFDAGVRLPNFNDGYQGEAPDMGAHEAGTPAMEFGVDAYRKGR